MVDHSRITSEKGKSFQTFHGFDSTMQISGNCETEPPQVTASRLESSHIEFSYQPGIDLFEESLKLPLLEMKRRIAALF